VINALKMLPQTSLIVNKFYLAKIDPKHCSACETYIEAEANLLDMLRRVGFPEPEGHKQIVLGRPMGSTTPDFFFSWDEDPDTGVCIYLDGMRRHIHGNPETRARDLQIRAELRARNYEVIKIPYGNLRHCFNTRARRAGIHDHLIMKITGHMTREMFERYDAVDEMDIIYAAEKLEKCSESAARDNSECIISFL